MMPRASRFAMAAAVLGACVLAAGCAHLGGGPGESSAIPRADSVTLALYHFDESGGNTCADDGPRHLNAIAGIETRIEFGRFGSARTFTGTAESWVYVPYSPSLDVRRITIDAWISPEALGEAEDTPIAGRWTEYANEQSWLFSLVGLRRQTRLGNPVMPGFHESLVTNASPGRLMFALQPAEAVPVQVFFSTREIVLGTWTHVAVSYDGEVVRFFVDERLDGQFAVRGTVRTTTAPLLIGNYFDTRRLTAFGGDMRVGTDLGYPPVYAFRGSIDELHISSEARALGGDR
jgi:hypothetical protein